LADERALPAQPWSPALPRRDRAELDQVSGRIVWHCPLCGDNGLIHGWEDTPWERQHDGTRSR
jgi:hypothetical protein